MDTNNTSTFDEKEDNVKDTVRSKDLSTRERVNFVVSSDIMYKLRAKSSREQIPMSRIIDAALTSYLTKSEKSVRYASLETGIAMSHLFELLLLISYQSALTATIQELVGKYFENFTYTRCAFKKPSQQSVVMGTKFFLFIRDEDNERFTELLYEVNKYLDKEDAGSIKLLLDGKLISL